MSIPSQLQTTAGVTVAGKGHLCVCVFPRTHFDVVIFCSSSLTNYCYYFSFSILHHSVTIITFLNRNTSPLLFKSFSWVIPVFLSDLSAMKILRFQFECIFSNCSTPNDLSNANQNNSIALLLCYTSANVCLLSYCLFLFLIKRNYKGKVDWNLSVSKALLVFTTNDHVVCYNYSTVYTIMGAVMLSVTILFNFFP